MPINSLFNFKGILIVLSALSIRFLFSNAQYSNYEVITINSNKVPFTNRFTSEGGQNTQLTNFLLESNTNQYPTSSSGSCDYFWSYQSDSSGETFGVISIPNPDYKKNLLRAMFSVASRLPSVSMIIFRIKLRNHVRWRNSSESSTSYQNKPDLV